MVLVSHLYKFIYIKNKKVAGSSVESFFGEFCIDPKNVNIYKRTDQIDESITPYGIVGRRLKGIGDKWVSHKTALTIKNDLGDEMFNNYFKFTIVRNPWDRVISSFYYRNHGNLSFDQIKKKFREYVLSRKFEINTRIYTINNEFICDFHIRYEHLKEDIEYVCEKLGIQNYDFNKIPRFKSSTRKFKHVPYWEYYDDETKQIVENTHQKEIGKFEYVFGQ